MQKFFSLEKTGSEANISIYGDISSWGGDVNAKSLVATLDELTDVTQINVYINSYGGEVAEGLAIYNALSRHKAKVVTYCDGFACSIASVIFMAGDERIMSDSSLLMIHNAWTITDGNADQLRKAADDLEKITEASVKAYAAHSTLSEKEIKNLMDAETWITPAEAIEYGFATAVETHEARKTSQSAKKWLFEAIKARQEAEAKPKDDENDVDDGENDEDTDDKPDNPPETDETDDDGKEDGDEEKADEGENNAPKDTDNTKKQMALFNAILKL